VFWFTIKLESCPDRSDSIADLPLIFSAAKPTPPPPPDTSKFENNLLRKRDIKFIFY
jgi:hypothetical protein